MQISLDLLSVTYYLLKGSVVLEELDELRIATSVTSGISGTTALLEVSRVYIAGPISGGGGGGG
jgi:hypothetical protein